MADSADDLRPVAGLLAHADPIRMALELAAATARENHREAFAKALDALDSELEQEHAPAPRYGTGWVTLAEARAGETTELSFAGSAASLVRDLAFRLADKDAEISRLTAELDAARNVPVEYVITRSEEH